MGPGSTRRRGRRRSRCPGCRWSRRGGGRCAGRRPRRLGRTPGLRRDTRGRAEAPGVGHDLPGHPVQRVDVGAAEREHGRVDARRPGLPPAGDHRGAGVRRGLGLDHPAVVAVRGDGPGGFPVAERGRARRVPTARTGGGCRPTAGRRAGQPGRPRCPRRRSRGAGRGRRPGPPWPPARSAAARTRARSRVPAIPASSITVTPPGASPPQGPGVSMSISRRARVVEAIPDPAASSAAARADGAAPITGTTAFATRPGRRRGRTSCPCRPGRPGRRRRPGRRPGRRRRGAARRQGGPVGRARPQGARADRAHPGRPAAPRGIEDAVSSGEQLDGAVPAARADGASPPARSTTPGVRQRRRSAARRPGPGWPRRSRRRRGRGPPRCGRNWWHGRSGLPGRPAASTISVPVGSRTAGSRPGPTRRGQAVRAEPGRVCLDPPRLGQDRLGHRWSFAGRVTVAATWARREGRDRPASSMCASTWRRRVENSRSTSAGIPAGSAIPARAPDPSRQAERSGQAGPAGRPGRRTRRSGRGGTGGGCRAPTSPVGGLDQVGGQHMGVQLGVTGPRGGVGEGGGHEPPVATRVAPSRPRRATRGASRSS